MAAEYEKLAQLLEERGFPEGAEATRDFGGLLLKLKAIPEDLSLVAPLRGDRTLVDPEEIKHGLTTVVLDYASKFPEVPVDYRRLGDHFFEGVLDRVPRSVETKVLKLDVKRRPIEPSKALNACWGTSMRVFNAIKRSYYTDFPTLGDLEKTSKKELLDVRSVGEIGSTILGHALKGPESDF